MGAAEAGVSYSQAAYKSRVRPMHRWRYAELEPEEMIKAFEKKARLSRARATPTL